MTNRYINGPNITEQRDRVRYRCSRGKPGTRKKERFKGSADMDTSPPMAVRRKYMGY